MPTRAINASDEAFVVFPLPNKRSIARGSRCANGPTLAKKKGSEVQTAHNTAARIEVMARRPKKRLFNSGKIRGFLSCVVHPGTRRCANGLSRSVVKRPLNNTPDTAARGAFAARRDATCRRLKLAPNAPQRSTRRKSGLEKRREPLNRIVERMLRPYAMQKHVRRRDASAREFLHEQRSRLHGHNVVYGARHGTAHRTNAYGAAPPLAVEGLHGKITQIGQCRQV